MGLLSKLFKPFKFLKKWLMPKVRTAPKTPIEVGQKYGSAKHLGVAYGIETIPGVVVDQFVTDDPGGALNDTYHVLIAFCAGEIQQVYEVYFDGVPSTYSKFAGKFTSEFRLGTANQTTFANAPFSRYDPVNSNYPGVVVGYFTFKQDVEQSVWNSAPEVTIKVLGRNCFDPRYNGPKPGTVYANPAICLLDYMKDPIWGPGLTDADINLDYIIREANAADSLQNVNTRGLTCSIQESGEYVCTDGPWTPSTVPRFTLNIFLSAEDNCFDNMVKIANTFRGYWPSPDGRLAVAGEREGEPVFYLNEENIINATLSEADIKDRLNRVTVQFTDTRLVRIEKEVFYPATDDPLYAQWLAEDNNLKLEKTIQADGTANPHEALQLAEIAVKTSRNAKQITCTGFPECQELDVGDIVAFSWADFGYVNKEFRVSVIKYAADGLVEMTLDQHEDAVYPWSETSYEDIQGGSFLGDPTNISAPVSLSITPDPTLATSGQLNWAYTQNAFVRRFLVELFVARTNYTLGIQASAGTQTLVLTMQPTTESSGNIVTIGSEQYTIQTVTASGFVLTTPLTTTYPAGTPLTTNATSEVLKNETVAQSYEIPLLDVGNYTLTVRAISTLGILSSSASIAFSLTAPVPPTSIVVTASNFELEVRPQLAGIGLNTSFEYAIGDTTTIRGRGLSLVFVGLIPGTEYTVFARTVNAYGVSDWVSQTATTTANGVPIIDLIGEDIAAQIFDDVVTEVNSGLQAVVDASLTDYSTTVEVDNIITNRINEVNAAEAEDPRVVVVAIMENAIANLENTQAIRVEKEGRVTVTTQLQNEISGTQSTITEVQQNIADLDEAITTDITALQAQADDNTAQIVITNQTVATLDSAVSTSLLELQSEVDGNTSGLIVLNQTVADLDSAITTSITSLQSQVDDNAASITTTNQTVATLTTATATSISELQSEVDGNTSSITNLNQTVADLDSATATSITSLESAVAGNTAQITFVNNTSVDRDNAISQQVTTLQSEVDDNSARITIVNNTSVDRDNAISSQITTLGSAVANNTAQITIVNNTAVDRDNAISTQVTTLQSQVGTNTSAISTTNQTVATLTSSTATQINSLQSQVDDNVAAITTTNQTVATLTTATSTQITSLQSQVSTNAASITTTDQTVATLTTATSEQFNQLQSEVDGNASEILETNQTVATLSSATASQFTSLTAAVGTNTANITTVSNALATETNTRATQYTQLTAADTTILASLDEVESDVAGNASAISTVQATISNPTTGLSAAFTLANTAKTTADGAASVANTTAGTVNNPTTGLSASYTLANTAKTTADGAASVANTTAGVVNNSTTGLSATYTLANQAKTTANGAASVSSTTAAAVNNGTTGLSATYTLASQAKTTADGAASSATSISNVVNNPTTGLAATATIANGAKTTADSALAATTGLQTQITSLDGELTSAQLILTSTVDELGDVSSRAYLGVSSTSGGVSQITGIVLDGATNALEFRADKLRLSSGAGVNQLYWDSARNKWLFTGDMVAGTFQTALSGYRAEMSGTGTSLPFWFGTGEKLWANANFAVSTNGSVKMNNVTATNMTATGGLTTGTGTAIRTEVVNDGTYLIWIGSGAKTDVNGLFWIKANGTGFIKGQFFSGQIIESKLGTYSSGTINGATVTASGHVSDGKPVEVTTTVVATLVVVGNTSASLMRIQGVIRRNGVTLGTAQNVGQGIYDGEFGQTIYVVTFTSIVVDTRTVAETRNYDVVFTVPQFPAGSTNSASTDITIKTFENKLA